MVDGFGGWVAPFHHFFLTSRLVGLYSSLGHPLLMEGFVVAAGTRHEPDFGPLFFGLLFRHGITHIS